MFDNWNPQVAASFFQADGDTKTGKYAKFTAGPFESGFGTIIGNSLRRVLLSSIRGAAITSVRIKEVPHEFTFINGVREDVTEIILNLKNVRFKLHSTDQVTAWIRQKGEGTITAGSISTGHNADIMNPDFYIATCGADADLEIEMTVKSGKGFTSADRNRNESTSVNTIVLDSSYSPIRKVNFSVSQDDAGYDNLNLEVWTDGSVIPEDAVAYAARIMQSQLSLFENQDIVDESTLVVENQPLANSDLDELLYRRLADFELSVRAVNALTGGNIRYIGELVTKTEPQMLKLKNFGRTTLTELKEVLADLGLSFGMSHVEFTPPEGDEEEEIEGDDAE